MHLLIYLWITVFHFVTVLICVKMSETSIFRMDGNITVMKYNEFTEETFAAHGNVIVRLSKSLDEIGRYFVGNAEEEDIDCKNNPFVENCKYLSNAITVLEIIDNNTCPQLFVCLKIGTNKCYILETATNMSFPLNFSRNQDDFFKHFSDSRPTSFLLDATNNSGRNEMHLIFAHNINLKYDRGYKMLKFFSVFSLIRISLNSVTNIKGSVNLLSSFRLHNHHKFNIVDVFQLNGAGYFIVKYWDHIGHASDAIIQLKRENNRARLLETRVRCADNFSIEQSSLLVDKDNKSLYLLFSKNSNDTQKMICDIVLSSLENRFDGIYADCLEKKKGSYPNWLTLSSSARSYGPCDPQEKDIESVFSPSPLFLRSTTGAFSLNGRFVGMDLLKQSYGIAVYLLKDNINLHKIKVQPTFSILASVDYSTASHTETSSVWRGKEKLYISYFETIRVVDINNCSDNTMMGTCVRDTTDCVWCQSILDHSISNYCASRFLCNNIVTDKTEYIPTVTRINPVSAPHTGGTSITIYGDNLDMAANISVQIGQSSCVVSHTVSDSYFTCKAPASHGNTVLLSVLLDGKLYSCQFTYHEVPNLITLTPRKSIASGGIMLSVEADNLNTSNEYYAYLETKDRSVTPQIFTKCKHETSDISIKMVSCISPPKPRRADTGFDLVLASSIPDSTTDRSVFKSLPLTVQDDPVVYYMGTDDENMQLQIKGHGFLSVEESEIHVLSDTSGDFIIESISDNVIVCITEREMSSHYISIRFGKNLVYYPGFVSMTINDTFSSSSASATTTNTGNTMNSVKETEITDTPRKISIMPETTRNLILIISIASVIFLVAAIVICRKRIVNVFKRRHRLDRDRPSIVSYRAPSVYIDALRRQQSLSISDGHTFCTDDALLTDLLDESAITLIQTFEEEQLLIKRESLELIRLIGQGNFGSVFKGFLTTSGGKVNVAVKTLHKNEHRGMDRCQFLKEAYVMKKFCHENVMKLVGICFENEEMPLVVLPFMEHGDLLSYLHEDKHIPTVKDLVSFGLDISEGMEYIVGLKFVHRDLAARNCMLDANYKVKVADFGLSRDVYETSYYSASSKGAKLPVKWMSIESLSDGVFNEKTDVWSYGVTLWELMTRGVRPYAAVDNWDMESYLKSGRRLPQPLYCPIQLYKVMRRCWSINPDDRPTFNSIRQCIADMLDKVHHQLGDAQKNSNISNVYVNLTTCSGCTYENQENL